MKKYLHPAIIKKDLTRFAPIWGLSSVFIALYLLLSWTAMDSAAELFYNTQYVLIAMGIITFMYALLCALFLFGDLFDTRLCNALHAMPISREGWFWSHVASGLLFCLIPAAVGTVISVLMLGEYYIGALLWLALTVLEFLFFFGAATLSATCAGTKLGAGAIYTVINTFVYLVSFVFTYLFQPLLYGVTVDLDVLLPLSPLAQLTGSQFMKIRVEHDATYNLRQCFLEKLYVGDWLYAGIVAIIGIGLLVLALVLYRKRHLEAAGNTVSFQPVSPILLVLYTLCAGTLLHVVAMEAEFLPWVMLLTGLIIGFFTGRMILEKQVKVFTKKNFLSFCILALSLALALFVTKLDPLGISRYVPKAENVVSVTMSPNPNSILHDGRYITLTEQEDIEKIIALNKRAIQEGKNHDYFTVCLHYKLKNGKKINREYDIADTRENREFVQSFYSRWECLVGNMDKETLLDKLIYIEVYEWDETFTQIWISEDLDQERYDSKEINALVLPKVGEDENVKQLIDAIYADSQNGTLSQVNNDTPQKGNIYLQLGSLTEDIKYIYIDYYENNENILNVLAQLKANDTP